MVTEMNNKGSNSDNSDSNIENKKRTDSEKLLKLCMHDENDLTCAMCGEDMTQSDAQSLVGTLSRKPQGKTCSSCGRQALVPVDRLGPMLSDIFADGDYPGRRQKRYHPPTRMRKTSFDHNLSRATSVEQRMKAKHVKPYSALARDRVLLERNRISEEIASSTVSSQAPTDETIRTWSSPNRTMRLESDSRNLSDEIGGPKMFRKAKSDETMSTWLSDLSSNTLAGRHRSPRGKRAIKQFVQTASAWKMQKGKPRISTEISAGRTKNKMPSALNVQTASVYKIKGGKKGMKRSTPQVIDTRPTKIPLSLGKGYDTMDVQVKYRNRRKEGEYQTGGAGHPMKKSSHCHNRKISKQAINAGGECNSECDYVPKQRVPDYKSDLGTFEVEAPHGEVAHEPHVKKETDTNLDAGSVLNQTQNINVGSALPPQIFLAVAVMVAVASAIGAYFSLSGNGAVGIKSTDGFSVEVLVTFWMVASTTIHLLTVLSTML